MIRNSSSPISDEQISALLGKVSSGDPRESDLDQLEGLLDQEEAARGLEDLYYFDKYILKYGDMVPKTHRPVCQFVSNKARRKKHLELPRGTFKSSVVTIGYPLQQVAKNPDIRVLIDNEVYSNSKAFLREIKGFMDNPEIQRLFPNLIPNKRINDGWTEATVIVEAREKERKEPTISCAGTDQIKVGMHYDLILMDDLVSPRNVTTPEQIQKIIDHYKLALSLLEPGGELIVIGTRYHYNDLYGFLLKEEKDTFDHLIIPAKLKTPNALELNDRFPELTDRLGKFSGGDLLFPERLTDEFLKEQRKSQGTYIFNCQYMLDPVDAETSQFKRQWLKYYRGHLEKNPDSGKQMLVVDWLGDSEKHTLEGYEFPIKKPIDVLVSVDPNNKKKKSSDYTGSITNAVTDNGDWFILDIDRNILDPGRKVLHIFDLKKKHDPVLLGIEEVGKEDIQYMLIQRMRDTNNFFHYVELKTGGVAKEDRISRLTPRFEYGTIFLPVSLIKTDSYGQTLDLVEALEDEIMYFPTGPHDDMLDSLAYQEDLVTRLLQSRRSRTRREGHAQVVGAKSNLPRYNNSHIVKTKAEPGGNIL